MAASGTPQPVRLSAKASKLLGERKNARVTAFEIDVDSICVPVGGVAEYAAIGAPRSHLAAGGADAPDDQRCDDLSRAAVGGSNLLEGFLKKRGPGKPGLTNPLRKRWFQITPLGKLMYFKSRTDPYPAGTIDFGSVNCVERTGAASTHEFTIHTFTRSYALVALSAADLAYWLDGLARVFPHVVDTGEDRPTAHAIRRHATVGRAGLDSRTSDPAPQNSLSPQKLSKTGSVSNMRFSVGSPLSRSESESAFRQHSSLMAPVQTTVLSDAQGSPNVLSIDEFDDYDELADIEREWIKADVRRKNKLGFKECQKLLRTLNIKPPGVRQTFRKYAGGKDDAKIDFGDFKKFYSEVRRRPDVEELFDRHLTLGKEVWSVNDFRHFLLSTQREAPERVTSEVVQRLIKRLEGLDPDSPGDAELTHVGFAAYFSSMQLSSAIASERIRVVWQDMTQPLSHYYISTSHNTCLEAGQLQGNSSVEAFRNAFARGARCVEFDCWNGKDGNPILTHGNTLTTSIPFRDAVVCVRDTAFLNNPWPIIISLDNHCSIAQQIEMASLFKQVLGAAGILAEPYGGDLEFSDLPSPEKLLRKVILKGNRLPPSKEAEQLAKMEAVDLKQSAGASGTSIGCAPTLSWMTQLKNERIAEFHHKGAGLPMSQAPATCVASFDENKLHQHVRKRPRAVIEFTHKRLLRSYPKATRITSSNFNPLTAWNHGVQLVALNFQTSDFGMRLNMAKFLDNGGCGYVLKPSMLTDPQQADVKPHGRPWYIASSDSKSTSEATTMDNERGLLPVRKKLEVTVLSGWQLPKVRGVGDLGSVVSPYVRVTLVGLPLTEDITLTTPVVKSNGFNPVFVDGVENIPAAVIKFPLRFPENELLHVEVIDATSRALVAEALVPVDCLRTGYRTLPLSDPDRFSASIPGASLLCRFDISGEDQISETEMETFQQQSEQQLLNSMKRSDHLPLYESGATFSEEITLAPWYFGQMSRDAAEKTLLDAAKVSCCGGNGLFLVRNSSQPGSLAISQFTFEPLLDNTQLNHVLIAPDGFGEYDLVNGLFGNEKFESLYSAIVDSEHCADLTPLLSSTYLARIQAEASISMQSSLNEADDVDSD